MTPIRTTLITLATATLLFAGPAASADSLQPTERSIDGLRLGGRIAHRLVSVHALHLTESAPNLLDLRVTATPSEVRLEESQGRWAARLREKGLPRLLVPGLLLKGPEEDYSVAAHRLLRHDDWTKLDPTRASDDDDRRDPAFTTSILPPALRWHVLEEPRDTEVKEASQEWARRIELDSERDSPLELHEAPRVKSAVAGYRKALSKLPAPPAGHRAAGFAVFIDGRLGQIEWTSSAADVASLWASVLDGLSVEAAYLESEDELLEHEKLLTPSDPRAERRWLRRALRRLRDGRADREPSETVRSEHAVRVDQTTSYGRLRALEWKDALAHAVFLRDPESRDVPGSDEIEPGPIRRRGPITGEEERVDGRRD